MSCRLSIGQLGKQCGLSRTALLNYERLGLLLPAARNGAGYRSYGPAELARARQIGHYRATGLSLAAIGTLLDGDGQASVIEARLAAISAEIALLREQQAVLVRLRARERLHPASPLDKAAWVALLRAAGMDDAGMARWHALFERQAPEAHRDFLRQLGIDDEEVARIRSSARQFGV